MEFLLNKHTVIGTLVKTNNEALIISKLELTSPAIDFPSGILEMPVHRICDPCGAVGTTLDIKDHKIKSFKCLVHSTDRVKDFLRTIESARVINFDVATDRHTPTVISALQMEEVDHWSKEIIEGAQAYFKKHNGSLRLKQVSGLGAKGIGGLENVIIAKRNKKPEKEIELTEDMDEDTKNQIILKNHEIARQNKIFEDKRIYVISAQAEGVEIILGGTQSEHDTVREIDFSTLTAVEWVDLDGAKHIPNRFIMELFGETTSTKETFPWKF